MPRGTDCGDENGKGVDPQDPHRAWHRDGVDVIGVHE
jgi:hypothetical protein